MTGWIHLDRVRFGFNGTEVFDELTLRVPCASTTAVVGANGSGKSTLLGLIAGTLRPHRGSVHLPGADEVALAVQHSQVSETFPITVAEAVAMGRWNKLGLLGRPSRVDRAIVDRWISEFGLDDVRRRKLGSLSGGQRQRTLLAQTFAQEAPTVVLDEPTVGLDTDSWRQLTSQVHRIAAGGTTVVTATHDVGLARGCDFCVLLGRGDVLATGVPADVLTDSNLAAALTSG